MDAGGIDALPDQRRARRVAMDDQRIEPIEQRAIAAPLQAAVGMIGIGIMDGVDERGAALEPIEHQPVGRRQRQPLDMGDVRAGHRIEIAERAGQAIFGRLGETEGPPLPQPIAQGLAVAEEARRVAIALRHDRIGSAHRPAEQGHVSARLRQAGAQPVIIAPGEERRIEHGNLHARTSRRSETRCRPAASIRVRA